METIVVDLGERSYPIHIGPDLLDEPALYGSTAKQALIVTNDVVAPLYLARVQAALRGRELETVVVPDGERHKTLATFTAVIDRLIEVRFHRDCCLVALGGGVVGDLAGYAAASYQRGVDFVQVPTTLLAQVDSSVGGKTAVNHPRAKNMIGAFHQPIAVLADTSTLRTLPPRELGAGLAEIVKYGVIVDAAFFTWLETHVEDLKQLDAAALALALSAGLLGESRAGRVACVAFGAGIALFSGSLYGMTLSGVRWLGAVTPLGGLAFMAGWLALALAALRG